MKWRYEKKYLVNNRHLEYLRHRLRSFTIPDAHASLQSDSFPEYTVRSIYFDTPGLASLYDKVEGLEVRRKLRIRGYNQGEKSSGIFVEIKRKMGDRIGKNRALVEFDMFKKLLENGGMAYDDVEQVTAHSKDLNAFLFYLKTECQQPVNLIVYDREPYMGLFDSHVRITFDKNIRSRFRPEIGHLFSNDDFSYVWKGHFILEIKYNEAPMPYWLKSLVVEFGLVSSALSKYAEGYFCHRVSSGNGYHLI